MKTILNCRFIFAHGLSDPTFVKLAFEGADSVDEQPAVEVVDFMLKHNGL
jgi:hypothetical protein